jgi:hypothetical protein
MKKIVLLGVNKAKISLHSTKTEFGQEKVKKVKITF